MAGGPVKLRRKELVGVLVFCCALIGIMVIYQLIMFGQVSTQVLGLIGVMATGVLFGRPFAEKMTGSFDDDPDDEPEKPKPPVKRAPAKRAVKRAAPPADTDEPGDG